MVAVLFVILLVLIWTGYELYTAPIMDEDVLVFKKTSLSRPGKCRPGTPQSESSQSSAAPQIEINMLDAPAPGRDPSETSGAA